MNTKVKQIAIVMTSLLGLLLAGCGATNTDSKTRIDQYSYFNIDKDSKDMYALVVQGVTVDSRLLTINGHIYIEVNALTEYVNDLFYWDLNETKLLYTFPDKSMTILPESNTYTVGSDENIFEYNILTKNNDLYYVAWDFASKYTQMECTKYTEPNRYVILNDYKDYTFCTVNNNTVIREGKSAKEDIVCDVSAKEEVILLEKGDEFSYVYSKLGFKGYIANSSLDSETVRKLEVMSEYKKPVYSNISKDYEICLVWHQMEYRSGNDGLADKLSDTSGITTISPTWFKISDFEGSIDSLASTSYVKTAHNLGLEVWALVNDFSSEDGNYYVRTVLQSTTARQRLIKNIITEALDAGVDGINIDFEQITAEIADDYIQFIRELSIECRNNKLVLSTDNYAAVETSEYYNRQAQAEVVDYVIIMGYDEHWAGSEEAGSVASKPFVENGITKTLEQVPADKLINAIPFYTRIWEEIPEELTDGKQVIYNDPIYGRYALDSSAVGMKNASNKLSEHGITPVWLEAIGQHYGEYVEDGITYRIWLEDTESISWKMEMINKYKLAGVACWKLGLEDTSYTWSTIESYLNK